MKLFMACVGAALSLTAAGCADEVATSGDTEISVKDTDYKANQDPKTRSVRPSGNLGDRLADSYNWNLIRFPSRLGVTAEELPPNGMNHVTEGLSGVKVNPAIAPAPYQGDRAMDSNYADCLTSTSITTAMTHDSELGGSSMTNGLNHDTTGVTGTRAVLIIQHDNDGTTDTATVSTEDGTFVCQVVQTRRAVISNTCVQAKKPPPVGGGVGGC